MKKYYAISIPKPCHEDWNAMSPKEKGKFCSSCSKTVIDFTKMNTNEIQDFIHENKNNRICGHFKQTQLDSIHLHIPSQILTQQQSFHKLFLLALLIVMGTTLMNCTNKNGNKQKIDSIEVVDNKNDTFMATFGEPLVSEKDSTPNNTCKTNSLKTPKIPELEGEVEIIGNTLLEEPIEENLVFGMIVETPAEFQNTPQNLSNTEKQAYFSKELSKFITENFNTSVCIELKGRQIIRTQFKIDKKGNITDIKIRAPHIKLEEEAIRVLKLLPQFIPATQRNKLIDMNYTIPIVFQAEEQ
ncbi:energy transducer TonB [Mariniflexile gromovii]|uniref:Energy transducer TonB n=1 Tax=Mariniflexile gromovii TaxID=362523 RepID=A0ABS4BR81_9FLAO|nr:energy transducer TonB [Mariniflexile gromovii]MBP0902605.1 energy transducer TonB [Mariniflexile gromovii]